MSVTLPKYIEKDGEEIKGEKDAEIYGQHNW